MYMLYLISAVAVSTGIGAFVQYDTITKARDLSDASRVEVTFDQQETISRSVRRQFQMNPGSFPSVSATGYAKLNTDLINASITQGGLFNLGESEYYITAFGDVLAVAITGPAAPETKNGDLRIGISGFDRHLDDFLIYRYGPNWERVTFEDGGSHFGGGIADDVSDDVGLPGALPEVTMPEVTMPEGIVKIGHLDMKMLDYEQTIAAHTGINDELQLTAKYEPSDFLAIQAHLANY
jgi:hypothetical protein